MSTDRETTRIVRSWLEEGVTALPDRVLDAVLDQVPATPQRRSWWPSRRIAQMNKFLPAALAAAAVLVVAVVGYNLLPQSNTVGPPVPTAVTPSPSPAPLARGTFKANGATVELDATGGASSVTGSMTVTDESGAFTVDLECTRTTNAGLIWIGGDVTESANISYAPKGTRAAIVFKRGTPVQAVFVFQLDDPQSASCQAFFDDMIAIIGGEISEDKLDPIEGTVELGP
ncbi:MAG TPA: hypothetical protein VMQ65_05030 [Candidatus Limnocylindria bacterium]|nr:hypothetical protein [Candidatus Limnocylindria bacterium]